MNADMTNDTKEPDAKGLAGNTTDRPADADATDTIQAGGSARLLSSAGAMLARARSQMGLSVGEVANHLKLSIRQVEAMEADAFDQLPSPMFVRGFAKSYARLVQIDPGPVMLMLDKQCPTPPPGSPPVGIRGPAQPQPLPRSPIPFPSSDQPSRRLHAVAALLAAVVIGFLFYEWFGPRLQAPGSPFVPAVAPDGPGIPSSGDPALPGQLPPTGGSESGQAPGADAPAISVPVVPVPLSPDAKPLSTLPSGEIASPGQSAGAAPAAAGALPASSVAAAAVAPAGGAAEGIVRLAFDREAWVEVRDGRGKLIFSQMNPPGSSQQVKGEPPLSLVVGNARNVRVTYGNRDVDLAPFIKVDVARFTLE